MTSTVVLSRHDLEVQRQRLLESLGVPAEELNERAENYTLTEEERSVWETLQGIDFLLDDA